MLGNLGYFRGIECPAIAEDGGCQRPYCHFRHANAIEKATCQHKLGQDINHLDHEFIQVSTDSVDSSEETAQPSYELTAKGSIDNYVPYTPHKAADLYKPFVQDSATPKTIDYSKLHSTTRSKKSVLHGARGATTTTSRSRQIKYSITSSSKPVNDLEYDPMCNYNLKTKSDKKKTSDSSDVEISTDGVFTEETADFFKDDVPDTDLVIDDDTATAFTNSVISSSTDNIQSENLGVQQSLSLGSMSAASNEDTINSMSDEVKSQDVYKKESAVFVSDSDSHSDVKMILGEERKKVTKKISSDAKTLMNFSEKDKLVTTNKSEESGKNKSFILKKKLLSSDDLFGTDSDNDTKNVNTTMKTANKIKNPSSKLKIRRLANKVEENSENISSKKSLKRKSEANACLPNFEKKLISKDNNNTKRKLKEKNLVKRKKLKVVSSSINNVVDISKYIDKEEIDKLDKELDDVGMHDECFRIYQESFKEKKVENCAKSQKPTMKQEVLVKSETEKSKSAEEVPKSSEQKSRRIAHATAANSASLLNRDSRRVRRRLTPSQMMMQRLEIIKQEQEEQMIQHTFEGLKELSRVKSSSSPSSKSQSSSRLAHQPSSSKNCVQLSKSLPIQRALVKKQPFQNLKRSPSTTSTTQETVSKGFSRVAHVPTPSDSNIPERPKIFPDRFSKVPVNIRQRYLAVFVDECLRILNKNHLKAYEMATMEEKLCNSRSNSKAIYLNLAASTMKRLRGIKCDSSTSTKQPDTKQNLNEPDNVFTKVAFKSNKVRISHGTSPNEASKLKKAKVAHALNKITKPLNKKVMSHKDILDKTNRTCKGGYTIIQKDSEKTISGEELYETLCHYVMTEDQLAENGFPRPGDYPGVCTFKVEFPKFNKDRTRKTCARCGKEFVLYKNGRFALTDDECIHHWGRAYSTKVGSSWEKRYSCCQTPIGTEGCSVGETHVHRENNYECNNYMKTLWKESLHADPGIYALDCEMAFTVVGLELIRVSVVDFECKLVYDTLVQPSGRVLDYNSRWSGLAEADLRGVTTSLRDVQAVFLSKFSSDTIFMGHSLESDLKALRIIHSTVIDTSVVFPHRLGPPYKRALRHLMAEHLGIIIQNSVDEGHDSTEDATACVKLMKWKLSEDMKVSR